MGIFSFLKRNQDLEDLDSAPSAPQEEEEQKVKLPDLRGEMPVEILGENRQVIISGLITEHNGQEIAISRCPGGLSFKLCEVGSSVVVRGHNSRMAQFYLRAVVAESSRIHMRLKDLEQEEVQEDMRETFRLAVSAPISVFDYADENMKKPKACTLVDISTGGCCISSKDAHEEGEVLRIRIKLKNYETMDFVGEVIRVMKVGDKEFRYGILFAQLQRAEHEALTRMLFSLQVGSRKERSQLSGGRR